MTTQTSILKFIPLALTLISSGAYADKLKKEFDVSDGGLLKITTDVGAIEIDSHNKDTVLVEVNIKGKHEDHMQVSFDHDGEDVTISGELERNDFNFFNGHHRLKVRYTVTVPENYNLDLDTSGGSITIEDLQGEIDAHTSGGSISLSAVHGDIDIDTSGGSINADDVSGKIYANTSGGSINTSLSKSPTADSKFTTSGGSINASLAKDIAVELHATTSGGRVKSEFDVDGSVKKNAVRGDINGGGPKLTLRTSGGSVRITEL